MRLLVGFAALSLGLASAGAASAITPYLLPTKFGPSRAYVTIESGMAESYLFVPNFPIRGEGDYTVTSPDGAVTKLPAPSATKELAIMEVALPNPGTYRISSGERLGRSGKMAKIDGVWRGVRPAGGPPRPAPRPAAPGAEAPAPRPNGPIEESALPPGAEVITTQSYLKAEVYVSRGSPSQAALKPTGQGFELAAESHPNEIFAGEAFKFAMLMNGAPAAGAEFVIGRGGDAYADQKFAQTGKTDANGKASVTIAQPGVYVLEVSYPPRVEGGDPVPRTDAYTLTFEVTR